MNFIGMIDSSGITCQSPEKHQSITCKVKRMLKLDIQAD